MDSCEVLGQCFFPGERLIMALVAILSTPVYVHFVIEPFVPGRKQTDRAVFECADIGLQISKDVFSSTYVRSVLDDWSLKRRQRYQHLLPFI